MLDSIKDSFTESIQIQIAAAEALPDAITHAAQAMVSSLLNGNKILCCGNGGSASNSQQFVSCLLNRFETERPSLPAMTLTADNTTLTAVVMTTTTKRSSPSKYALLVSRATSCSQSLPVVTAKTSSKQWKPR